jgi:hypothetical protein
MSPQLESANSVINTAPLALPARCARARASVRPVSRCYWPLPSSSQCVCPQRARAVWRMSRGIGRPAHRRQPGRGRAGRQGATAAAGYEAAAVCPAPSCENAAAIAEVSASGSLAAAGGHGAGTARQRPPTSRDSLSASVAARSFGGDPER